MNKKFSTLMASALLATSVGAFAQISNPAVVTPAIEEGRWYALGVGSGSWTEFVGVSQNADGVMEFKVLDQTDPNTLNSLAKIDSALWKITPVAEGQNVVRFKLTNKATGLELSFDTKNAVDKFTTAATDQSKLIGGSTEYWYWYAGRNAAQVNSAEELTVNFHNGDSTMVIKRASDDVLYVAKDVNDGAATPGGITLQVLNPGTWVMSASDLNTKGDKVKYMELSFAEGAEANNPFAGKLQAQQLIGNPDTVGGTSGTVIPFSKYMDPTDGAGTSLVVEKGWSPTANSSTDNTVILNKLNEDGELTNSYLHIDTTYYKGSGADLMRYNEIDFSTNTVIPVGSENAIDTLGYNLPVDAFRFMFTKNLLTDSIKVETFSSFVKMNTFMTPKNQKGNAVTQYTMIGTSGVADAQRFGVTSGNYNAALRDSRGNVVTSGGTLITSLVADGVQNNVYPLNNVLSICELTGGDVATAVTFYNEDTTDPNNRPESEYVNLWAYADNVGDDYASILDGVYTIKDAETGEYLGVQIYSPDSLANFYGQASIESMNFDHIPAFQWVILKNDRASAEREAVSPLTITNREFVSATFTDNIFTPVQLRKGSKAGQYLWNGKFGSREVIFDEVENIDDEYVGYKNLKDEDLKVERYTFNYWHSFDQGHYLALNAEDSLLNVASTTPGRFKITGTKEATYGYNPKATGADKYIEDLVQLKRRAYTVEIQGVGSIYSNKEDHYMVTKQADATNDEQAYFYFKENNEFKKGENTLCYYALIDTMGVDTKGGVVDNDNEARLWSQVLGESRTSVFAVEKDDAPLYRRFDVEALEGNVGDAPDTLRFIEKYRGEYLQMESNPNFVKEGIDFLGIDDASEAEGGLAFIVDTAFVERWNGNIKPQYLVSIDRTDEIGKDGKMCSICEAIIEAGGERPANCPHDEPGKLPFHFGKYLVNFADSVTNAVDPSEYKWAGYTRVGFVKAAHMGDSLYILKDQFADVTLATFDTAAIKKAVDVDKTYAKENIINLQGDAHKKVTWSFRYVNPEEAGQPIEENRAFLFESLNTDGNEIAPSEGQWLKMQNGCLVMSGSNGSKSTFNEVRTGDDDALIFNVEPYAGNDDIATDNDEVSASEVTVIAGNGQITINGAAGKKVVVSNILGQVVANTVITSDNATIAAPQGVVVVAVEGEEAVKAIVK